jgi:RpiB/LacA/LacB family sugar-phosphate isomerase
MNNDLPPVKIAIASDHAGFSLKEILRKNLELQKYEVLDLGTHSTDPVDYPDYAEAVGLAIRERRADRGILLCGSGVGVTIAANKIPGVRACACTDAYSAHQGVEHDAMNVLVIGAWIVGEKLAEELVGDFLKATFSNEPRHIRRLQKVAQLESRYRQIDPNKLELTLT